MMLFAWTFIHFGWTFMRREMDGNGRRTVQMLAELGYPLVVKNDVKELDGLLRRIKSTNPDMAGGAFLKPDGTVLASQGQNYFESLSSMGQPVGGGMVFTEPIGQPGSKAVGAIVLSISKDRTVRIMRAAALFVFLSVLIMFAFMFFLLHYFVGEIKKLQVKIVMSEQLTAMEKLSAAIAYELRDPLNTIQNTIYYLKDGLKGKPILKSDPTMGSMLEISGLEIKNAMTIVDNLLTFSKALQPELAPVNLNSIISGLGATIPTPANVQVDVQLDGALPQVQCDLQMIRQVFSSIATNALQAMAQGGKLTIVSRLEPRISGQPRMVSIDFIDTGCGIAPDIQTDIFEPLFTTKPKGTGLGLALSREIVNLHHGKLSVRSESGKGATFSVKIPVSQPQP